MNTINGPTQNLLSSSERKPMVEWMKGKKVTLAIVALFLAINIGLNIAHSLNDSIFTIASSGTIGIDTARPLHVEGNLVKNDLGKTIYLRGGWVPVFEDTCNARAALAGENWNSYLSKTTWRPEAVNLLLNTAKSWGFTSIASFIWIDWWIYNCQTELGLPRDSIVTDRPYQQNIAEFLTLAEQRGIYVQIRPYGVEAGWGSVGEGRVNFPFPVTGESYTHDGHIIPDANAFADFWYDVAFKLAKHPNVIFNLYDEPIISNRQIWFDAAELAIQKIREAENSAGGYKHLVQVHWAFCGGCLWMENWIQQGKPLDNIIFSNHIYRDQGTLGTGGEETFGRPPYPFDYDTQKAILQYKPNDANIPDPYKPYGRSWKYMVDTYNVSIVATFGANTGWSSEEEYQSFQNVASILNEWGIGYWVYVWWRTGMSWSIVENEPVVSDPNRVGQALISAIAAAET